MAKITFNGGMGYVGGNRIVFENGKKRIMMDYGMKVGENPDRGMPQYDVEDAVDALLLSHAHLDHSGSIPELVTKNLVGKLYTTGATGDLTEMLLLDSLKISKKKRGPLKFDREDVERTMGILQPVNYREHIKLGEDVEMEYFDAGHILGSGMIGLEMDGKYVLYTGDFNTQPTRSFNGCERGFPKPDALIIEGTYSDRNHPDRESQEDKLAEIIEGTMDRNGTAVISVFGVGRPEEILMILDDDKYGITSKYDVYVDGMAKKALEIVESHRHMLKDPESFTRALDNVNYVYDRATRDEIANRPSVVITTSGMLKGGPVVSYLKALRRENNCSLIMTGYQAEGTPGRVLLETGRYKNKYIYSNGESRWDDFEVRMKVEQLDFSAHAGGDDLERFIADSGTKDVFIIHGDDTKEYARKIGESLGVNAVAPSSENRVFEI